MSDIDLKQAQWTYELALGGFGEIILRMIDRVGRELTNTPKYKLFKIFTLKQQLYIFIELYECAREYKDEQEKASKNRRLD